MCKSQILAYSLFPSEVKDYTGIYFKSSQGDN